MDEVQKAQSSGSSTQQNSAAKQKQATVFAFDWDRQTGTGDTGTVVVRQEWKLMEVTRKA